MYGGEKMTKPFPPAAEAFMDFEKPVHLLQLPRLLCEMAGAARDGRTGKLWNHWEMVEKSGGQMVENDGKSWTNGGNMVDKWWNMMGNGGKLW